MDGVKYERANQNEGYGSTSSSPRQPSTRDESGSSAFEAAINLSKLCIGSGILALPFAAERGGLLTMPLLIAFVGLWNIGSCQLMISCKRACTSNGVMYATPPEVTSTYSQIAYCAGGWPAVYLTDFCIVVTLMGVCVTYLITFMTLVRDIGVSWSPFRLALLSAALVYPSSCSTDISKLTFISFSGLVVLVLAVFALVVFGLHDFGEDLARDPLSHLSLFPVDGDSFASATGIAIFGFGLPSLAFPIEESMKNPGDFWKASWYTVLFVCIIYTVVGVGVSMLFVHDPRGISSNVLTNLPADSMSAHIVRLLMSLVCVSTFPLAFIPPAEMMERMTMNALGDGMRTSSWSLARALSRLSPFRDDSSTDSREASEHGLALGHLRENTENEIDGEHALRKNDGSVSLGSLSLDEDILVRVPPSLMYLVRAFLLLICECLASSIPCFGLVVSLLGCFTVTILSFVIPPYLSLSLLSKPKWEDERSNPQALLLVRDCLLIILGVGVCCWSSVLVWQQCLQALDENQC